MRTLAALGLTCVLLCSWLVVSAGATDYFIAVDGLPTLTSGTFAGQPNPNFGRLTLLVAHRSTDDPSTNHFHAIGAHSLASLEGGGQAVLDTSTNNRIPELFTGALPLRLVPGSGPFAGKLVSASTDAEYSHLRLQSIQALTGAPAGTPDALLFNSSSGRWTTPLTGVVVGVQRISLTPGLHVADENGNHALKRRVQSLGDGDTVNVLPVYWTYDDARVGTYSATFKLVDLRETGTPLGESGRFTFDFRVARLGDLDGDNDVDAADLVLLNQALGSAASGLDDARDLNQDGVVDQIDLNILVNLLATQ
jgi:hypothetical protein